MDSCVLWSMIGTKVYKKCAQIKELEQQRDDLRDACEAGEITLRDIASRHISNSFHNNRVHSDAYDTIDILVAAIASAQA